MNSNSLLSPIECLLLHSRTLVGVETGVALPAQRGITKAPEGSATVPRRLPPVRSLSSLSSPGGAAHSQGFLREATARHHHQLRLLLCWNSMRPWEAIGPTYHAEPPCQHRRSQGFGQQAR